LLFRGNNLCETHFYKRIFINGSNDPSHVANTFADHFTKVYVVNADMEDKACSPHTLVDNNNDSVMSSVSQLCLDINVELIDKCIKKLKLGKAGGFDGLSAEHLIHGVKIAKV